MMPVVQTLMASLTDKNKVLYLVRTTARKRHYVMDIEVFCFPTVATLIPISPLDFFHYSFAIIFVHL